MSSHIEVRVFSVIIMLKSNYILIACKRVRTFLDDRDRCPRKGDRVHICGKTAKARGIQQFDREQTTYATSCHRARHVFCQATEKTSKSSRIQLPTFN